MFFGRKLLIGLLAFGTVAGYAHGFASLGHCASRHEARRAAFEAHVAEVCTRAAHRVHQEDALPPPHRDGHEGHDGRHADGTHHRDGAPWVAR